MRKKGPARACPAVDILKATRQGAAPVQRGCQLYYRGARWRNLANTIEPSVCNSDPAFYIKLL